MWRLMPPLGLALVPVERVRAASVNADGNLSAALSEPGKDPTTPVRVTAAANEGNPAIERLVAAAVPSVRDPELDAAVRAAFAMRG